jgi:CrcB protein
MTDPGRGDDELPLDSDVEVEDIRDDDSPAGHPDRPAHRQPLLVLLVGLGGAVGTLARFGLQQAVPAIGGVPVITVLINIVGAFLLGLLLETLARRGEDHGRRRALRLLLGTGALGGFTTYSALSVDTVGLFREGEPGPAVLYALVTVVLGAGATALGIATGVHANRRSRGER